jgi:hypothetical protein
VTILYGVDSASDEIVFALDHCAKNRFCDDYASASKFFVQNQYKLNKNGIFHYKEYKNEHLTKNFGKKPCNRKLVLRLLGQRGNVQKSKMLAKIKRKESKFFRVIPAGVYKVFICTKKSQHISCLCTLNHENDVVYLLKTR